MINKTSYPKLLVFLATTFLLFGCSEEDVLSPQGGTTIDPVTGIPTTSTLSIGSGSGTGFTEGELEIKNTQVVANGSIDVSAFIVDANNDLSTASNSVTFTSHCAIQGLASFTSTNVTTATGIATTTYIDGGCQVEDTIIAIADWDTFLTASGDITIDSSAPATANTIRIGTGTLLTFTEGAVDITPTNIASDGSATVSVNLVDANGDLLTSANTVTFTSDCEQLGAANFNSSLVTTSTGTASTTYNATGCVGNDVISASITVGTTTKIATGSVTVAAAAAGSIQFTSATPSLIALKGTGSTTGLPENSTITFTVLDDLGNPVDKAPVTFTLNSTLGGITLSNTVATSDASGIVTTIIQSGNVATSVRVSATIDLTTLTSNSDSIVIATGPPDQDSMSLAATTLNPRAWNVDLQTVAITVQLGDRFNNKIQDGTAVLFTTELGAIDSTCLTVDGACSVNWTSGNPRGTTANAGRSTILATVAGEESFDDLNANGVYDAGEPYTDLGEAFLDKNENGVHDSTESFIDFDGDNIWDGPDGQYNGSGSAVSSVSVRASLVLVMAENIPAIHALGTNGTIGNLCNSLSACDAYLYSGSLPSIGTNLVSNIVVTFGGLENAQTLPADTSVKFTADNGEILGSDTRTIYNSTSSGNTMMVMLGSDTTPSNDGFLSAEITIGDGGGTYNFPIVAIDDTGTFVAPSTILLGTGSGVGFDNGALDITTTTLAAGSSTNISVNIVDSISTALITDPTTITFSSTCASSNDAIFSNPIIATITGSATTTYTPSNSCTIGVDQITAISGSATATGTVTVTITPPPPPVPASIQFESASATLIALKGTGSATGVPENSTITFTVLDNSGTPVANESVTFALNSTIGGITLSNLTAISDADGLVTTVIQSGTVATSVSISVVVDSNATLTTTSSAIVIATGPPDQDSMSLSVSTLNPRAWNNTTHTATVTITARLADRFNNPIQDGTNILLTTELGSIGSSCTTVDGACFVEWQNSNPLGDAANAGRSTILATVVGEESFVDLNANGIFDGTDTFTDLGEAFVDANENGTHEATEPFIDFNDNGSWDAADGKFNGSGCAVNCSATSSISVRSSIVLVLAEDTPAILALGYNGSTSNLCNSKTTCDAYLASSPVLGTNIAQSLLVTLGGIENAQALPSGTDVSFSTANGEIITGAQASIGFTTSTSTFYMLLGPDATPSYNDVTDFLSVDINIGDGGSPFNLKIVGIDDTGSAVAPSSILLGTGEGIPGTFVDGVLDITTTNLAAGGSTAITVNVVDSITGIKDTTDNTVTFSSTCATNGDASFDNPSVITITGTVTVTYTSSTCSGPDVITATSGSATATGTITVAPASAGSIQFTSASDSLIALRGTGNTTGLPESSDIIFTVVDGGNNPKANEWVNFSLDSTVGGITLTFSSAQTDALGQVTATVESGTVATSVRVTAEVDLDPTLATTSSAIVIATGPPDQDSISLSASALNPRAWNVDGTEVTITARLADRFNNRIQDGTAILFTTELGSIGSSCTTVDGACFVTWKSQSPRTALTDISDLGRTTIIATVEGEESFTDFDSDGVFSDGDSFTDLPESYRDDNENYAYDAGEEFINFDSSNGDGPFFTGWNDVSGTYNGSGCSHSTLCDPNNSITVRDSLVLVMAEDTPSIVAIGINGYDTTGVTAFQCDADAAIGCICVDDCDGNDSLGVVGAGVGTTYPGSFELIQATTVGSATFTIAGISNEQVLPVSSTINFGASNGTITAGSSHTVPTTSANPATGSSITQYTVYLKADDTPTSDGVLNITATVAGMAYGFAPIDLNETPTLYTVSGSLSGTAIATGSLSLLNNGGDAITFDSATGTSFTFPGLPDGEDYAVTVVSNTTTLTCVVTGGGAADGSGTIAAADVTNIDVACAP